MSYVKSVLQPGERIIIIGRLHWIIFNRAISYLIIGVFLLLIWYLTYDGDIANIPGIGSVLLLVTAALFGVLALVSAIRAWFIRWTTEIAVTNRRIIYKRGFVTRHTAEMNMDKVASIEVDQGILGRILDYGSVYILGTGGASGIERLDRIASPVALRNEIVAK